MSHFRNSLTMDELLEIIKRERYYDSEIKQRDDISFYLKEKDYEDFGRKIIVNGKNCVLEIILYEEESYGCKRRGYYVTCTTNYTHFLYFSDKVYSLDTLITILNDNTNLYREPPMIKKAI